MATKKIKAALIGSGAISKTYLNNLINSFHIIDMVGCSDIIPERSAARAAEFGIRDMTNEEILNDKEIEIVVNTTYPLSHYEVTKAALLAGKHVYTEKMLAVTLEEGKELVALAKSKNLHLTIAPDTFLGGGWQTVRNVIDTGMIGNPITASGICIRAYHDTGETLADRKGFVFSPGGGIPFDMGGYYLHAFINLFGPIKRVSGFVQTRNPIRKYVNPRHPKYGESYTIDSPNTIVGALEFENGAYVTLTITSEASLFTTPTFVIHGTEGILTCFDPNDFNGEVQLQRDYGGPKAVSLLHGYTDDKRGIAVADMAYAIKNNRRPRAHYDMGYHAFEAIHGIIKSCDTGQVYVMESTCQRPRPIPIGQLNGSAQETFLDN
ncbi:MAG: Gfo/Idh/MocA family oxidoreductase [Firmicutes bacterium]|nr:Gfo/Idh/MocA family oxidoreductase [Bacillota bacterium]